MVNTVAAASSAPQPATTSHHLTWADLRMMGAAQVGALQGPLLAASAPVVTLGQAARWSSLFGGISLDTPANRVDLYVTDTARAGLLLAAGDGAGRGWPLPGTISSRPRRP